MVSGFIENCLMLLLNHPATEKFWNQKDKQCIIKSTKYQIRIITPIGSRKPLQTKAQPMNNHHLLAISKIPDL